MSYINTKTGELKDEKVVKDILRAADLYQDGCIAEAQSILRGIVSTIDEFEEAHDEKMRFVRR